MSGDSESPESSSTSSKGGDTTESSAFNKPGWVDAGAKPPSMVSEEEREEIDKNTKGPVKIEAPSQPLVLTAEQRKENWEKEKRAQEERDQKIKSIQREEDEVAKNWGSLTPEQIEEFKKKKRAKGGGNAPIGSSSRGHNTWLAQDAEYRGTDKKDRS